MAVWIVSTTLKYNIPLLFVLPVAVIFASLSLAKSVMDFSIYCIDFTPPHFRPSLLPWGSEALPPTNVQIMIIQQN